MNYANVIRNESKNYSGRKFCETNSTSIIIVQQIISLDPFPMASTSSFDKIKQKKIQQCYLSVTTQLEWLNYFHSLARNEKF